MVPGHCLFKPHSLLDENTERGVTDSRLEEVGRCGSCRDSCAATGKPQELRGRGEVCGEARLWLPGYVSPEG